MIIVRYNLNDNIDQVVEICRNLRELNFKDEEIIFFPQDWDILFNCSITDLQYFKGIIERAINRKEEQLNEKIKSITKGSLYDSRKNL